MRRSFRNGRLAGIAAVLLCLTPAAIDAQIFDVLVTNALPELNAADGGGDSGEPCLSADGRFVLFVSSASDLAANSGSNLLRPDAVPTLNVFLRDRKLQRTELVSVNCNGTRAGNGNSIPGEVSTNGQFVAFESLASDLVSGDANNASDVFVRNMSQGQTFLVSVSTNGTPGNGASRDAVMTPDGRYVAFVSAAENLVTNDSNGLIDVFIRDLRNGVTKLVSVGAMAAQSGLLAWRSASEAPAISADGRYVAFWSTATNLVPGQVNARDIYVRDVVAGTTTRASKDAQQFGGSVWGLSQVSCYNHTLSDDGRYVAYEAGVSNSSLLGAFVFRYGIQSDVTDLLHTNAPIQFNLDNYNMDLSADGERIVFVANTNSPSGTNTCVVAWDSATGATTLVSGGSNGEVSPNSASDWPDIDASGRFVVFSSRATNLAPGTLPDDWHFYLRDLQSGAISMLDADTNGIDSPVDQPSRAAISDGGRYAAFECGDSNLVPGDSNGSSDVFVRDTDNGHIELVSVRDAEAILVTPNAPVMLASRCLSADGTRLVFASYATNLSPGDTNGVRDVFLNEAGINLPVSLATNGWGNSYASEPAISGNGRFVAFTSQADNLVPGDTNNAPDVFVRDLETGTTTLASMSANGRNSGNNASYLPAIGSDGKYVTFRSKATDLLVGGSFSGRNNLFLRDLQTGSIRALTTTGVYCADMSPDGRYVAFVDMSYSLINKMYVWSSDQAAKIYTSASNSIATVSISPDGNRIAYGISYLPKPLYAVDRASGVNWAINTNWLSSLGGYRFSADGRFLVYAAGFNRTNQVYVFDFAGGTNLLVSHAANSAAPAFGHSDSPDITPDGRFIVFRSAATNIVPGFGNGERHIYLFDRQTGTTLALTPNWLYDSAGNSRSALPAFSPDGSTLVFQSWASDLVESDYNHASDLFWYKLYASGEIPVFVASILRAQSSRPVITWPAVPGRSYQVQYRENLSGPFSNWQQLNSPVQTVGSHAWCEDLAPSGSRRFYRIVGF